MAWGNAAILWHQCRYPPVSLLLSRALVQTDAPRLIHADCTHGVKGGIGSVFKTLRTWRRGVFFRLSVGVESAFVTFWGDIIRAVLRRGAVLVVKVASMAWGRRLQRLRFA